MPQKSQDVWSRIEREKQTYLDELVEFLRIPSISTDPAYDGETRRAGEFLVARLREAGLEARLIESATKPLVYAEWLGAPGKKTLLSYGHYDVQPADPLELWRHPPFEPTFEDDGEILVARGATDDKGQSYAHVKAVAAILKERGRLPCNVKFIIEGEEESGGAAIEAFVRADRGQLLSCDAVLISDSSMYAPGQPSLVYALKGLSYAEIHVDGANRDLHSGAYGGGVANPANALAYILGQLRDPVSGLIKIPGFYDRVRPLEAWEREEFQRLPFDEDAYRHELGLEALFGEAGYSTVERLWARPTCDVNGIFGGYQGVGAKTVIPAKAGAKLSMRLVPDQEPHEIFRQLEAFVQAIKPAGVKVEVKELYAAWPVLLETQGEIVEAAQAAMADVWKTPFRVREGGSIPIITTFSQVLGVPILLLGFGLADDRLHSPNEKFNVSNFYGGIKATVCLLDRLGDL